MRGYRQFIFDNPGVIPFITACHRVLYRWSGGWVGGRWGATRILMLTTTGRKTGKERVTPLLYVEDADRWVVVASNGGTETVPAWWLNLEKHPEAGIQVGRQRHRVRARRANDAEVDQLWPELTRAYEFFDGYRDRTQREIPVVILERVEG